MMVYHDNVLNWPGAKLLTVTDNGLPPPGICYVLFAGTNDVTADESHTIFEHLERQLTVRLSSSAVIVSTVPHRHDLSMDHAVNQRIALVNFYIEELSVRYKGIEVLNFNEIGGGLPNTSPTIRPPTSAAHAASSCATSSTPLSSLPVQDRQQLSSEALSPTAVQPVEPVIVGSTTSRPVPLLLLHQNAQSATNKLDEIQLMCAEMKTDVLVLTENGFNNKNIDLCKIPNFTLANSYCRQLSKGGGVGIFVRKNYTFFRFHP
ncbi:hypothetical protein J6590_083071 [Homalodisca vitripennis]|nr:hypothetical protein J6590_083071 [Homalodisca vitripennis]